MHGLAAGIIRVIAVNQPMLQVRNARAVFLLNYIKRGHVFNHYKFCCFAFFQLSCIARGALGHLLTMCKSQNTFNQEQAAAALCSLLPSPVGSITELIRALDGVHLLATALTSHLTVKAAPFPSKLVITAVITSLNRIGEADATVFLKVQCVFLSMRAFARLPASRI